MKVLHHGYAYQNYCKCRDCDCEFIYEDNETISVLDKVCCEPKSLVWTYIICPECNEHNTLYNYKGKINKIRIYSNNNDYDEIDFDENTMEKI